jgi:glutaredoxin
VEGRDRGDGSGLIPVRASKPGSLWPLLLIVALVWAGSRWAQHAQQSGQLEALRAKARPGDILMLGSETCVFCDRARQQMSEAGVPFRECTIERDAACAAQYRALLSPGTPTFVVRGQRIVGFDRERIVAALTPR